MKFIEDIVYDTSTGQVLDLYLPDGETRVSLLFIHGGGLAGGDRRNQLSLAAPYLAAQGIAVFSIEYRTYPAAKYPEYITDAASACAFVKKELVRYTGCDRLFVCGSSAGGYITMMLCFDKQFLAAHGLSPLDFDGFIHDAGQPTCHFKELEMRGLDSRRILVDARAPLYHIGTAENYPPMHFIVSDNDLQSRYEQTMLTLSTLRHFGYDETKISHEVRSGTHCHYLSQADEDGESVYGKMLAGRIHTWMNPN